jgi:hypothetical protein
MEDNVAHTASYPSESANTFLINYINGVNEQVDLSRAGVQARLTGIQREFMLYTLLSFIFLRNLHTILKTFRRQLKNLSAWCVFVVSLLGATSYPITVIGGVMTDITCTFLASYDSAIICVSSVCNSIILLHKAYLALLRRRWIIIVGSLTILFQIGMIVYNVWPLPISVEPSIGCVIHYTDPMLITWLITVLPNNLFFSGMFSYVAYNQYKMYGTEAWRRLAKDGIRTMCLVVICNLICGIIVSTHTFGDTTQIFFIIDW